MLALSPGIQQWVVLLVTFLVVALLLVDKYRPSFVFGGAILVLLLSGIIHTNDFLASVANESIITIFLLIFITTGIKENFNLVGWLDKIFGKTTNGRTFMFKMTTAVATVSSVMNNTPIVALMIPYVYQWAKKHEIAPSKLLIPLSFAAIVGGMITVIGTSTNLVLNGFILSKNDQALAYTDFLYLGLLVTAAGLLFLYFVGYRLLPSRTDAIEEFALQAREYLVETKVRPSSKFAGKTVAEANLRNLKGLYLFEIVRNGSIISPVSPRETLCVEDKLFFAGDTENIVELVKAGNGLELHANHGSNGSVNLLETVVPANSTLIGHTLKGVGFRESYDAAAVAIHRNGEKLRGKIGEIVIKAGDMLLISAGENFERIVQENNNLYLVSVLAKTEDQPAWKKNVFISSMALTVLAIASGFISLFLGLLVIVSVLLWLELLTLSDLQKNLDFELLLILVCSLTFSKALIESGTAKLVADSFIPVFDQWGDRGLLLGMFLITVLLTTFVTNVAAISIVFPVVYALCHGANLPTTPFYVAIAFAASASFLSPFGYQTNLMVYGPGGYKFKDFIKVGLPITIIYSVICIIFIVWYYNL
ncbi:SLC13 family permease [Pontibacter sp. SGAir0037]|uniref:SLC13 family permease n=1 Tax=Pontibacter sp. SGAir0037 TaxID=2571030 RepID=UPI0010CD3562|nr:SLC13 family permease [Pontibacter sp. SGAir0037]QCR20968.1 SLC13 family permease [Pontibacter sp. SGAir0037]